MSSSTSMCSSTTRSPRPPSTTHTSPDGQDKLHNQQQQQQGAPFKGQESITASPSDTTITFEKRDIVALKPTSPPPSTFSSFSPTNIDNASSTNNTSASSSTNNKHFHGLSTSCDCDEPPSLHSRLVTPAYTLPAVKDEEQIGTHLPFESSSSSAENYQHHHHPAYLTKSQSMVSVPALPAARLLSDAELSPPVPALKKSSYKPAKHVLRPKSPPTVHSRKPEMRLVFNSEEEARQAAILRNNYSLPPSPGSRSATSSGMLTPQQPRRQLGEPRTPLYMPAAVLRRPPQVQTAQVEKSGDSYFTDFAHSSPGPPTKSHWKPDSSRNACAQCSRLFTLFERRHHCRRCGDIFCALHSRFKVELDSNVAFNPFSGVSSKACMSCSIEYQEFKRSYLEPAPSSSSPENVMIPIASPSVSHAGHDNLSSSKFGSSVQNSVPADWQWSTF